METQKEEGQDLDRPDKDNPFSGQNPTEENKRGFPTAPKTVRNKFAMRNALRNATHTQNSRNSGKDSASDPKLEREIESLQKQAKRREAEFSKIKAVLEQKLELKDLQLIDLKENMEGQKDMYNSMLKALQNKSENTSYEQQLESIKEMQRKQDSEINEIRQKYEKQITDLKERINMQEFNEKSLKAQLKQEKGDYEQELQEKEKQVNELQLKIQKITLEKERSLEKLRDQIENMEEKHLRFVKDMEGNTSCDIEKLTQDYESKLNDIKYLKDQEVLSLKNQIRKLEEELLILREQEQSFQLNRDSEFENENVKVLDIRLSEINDKFADDMLASEKEIARLKRENGEKETKIEALHLAIEKLKSQMDTRLDEKDQKYSKLKDKFNDKCTELLKTQKKIKDNLNLKKRISDLKMVNSKLEKIKRDLKDSLKIKENELETERAFRQKAVYEERRKNKTKGEKMTKMRKEMDLQNIEIESLRRENNDTSMMSESRFFSPRPMRRKRSGDSSFLSPEPGATSYLANKNLDSSQYINDSTTYSRNARRLKSSSPSRTQLLVTTTKMKIGGLGRGGNSKRMIQISDEKSKLYDDSHIHCHGSGRH